MPATRTALADITPVLVDDLCMLLGMLLLLSVVNLGLRLSSPPTSVLSIQKDMLSRLPLKPGRGTTVITSWIVGMTA